MYKKHVLKNGSRLLLVPQTDAKTVTILVLFSVGSRYETPEINGISHFLEHMFFKGTKKFPTTLDLSKQLDAVGAEYNAFTGKDVTGYYIKVSVQHIDLALDVLSEMLLHSLFDQKELDRERGVIIEEINMYEDNPIMYVEEVLEKSLYEGNPLGYLIAGPRENIRDISREQMIAYKDAHYLGQNSVIAVSGGIENGEVKEKVEKFFGALPGKPDTAKDIINFSFPSFARTQDAPRAVVLQKPIEQMNLGIGFGAYSYFDEERYAMKLLSVILGGNMSSRLFIQVRERRGLAYFIHSSVNPYQDTGNLFIQAGIEKSQLLQAIEAIFEELTRFTEEGVTSGELKRAQTFLEGKFALNMEDTSNVARWFAMKELMTKSMETPQEALEKYFAVTRDDIMRVARDIFKKERANIALIGPHTEEQELLDVVAKSKL